MKKGVFFLKKTLQVFFWLVLSLISLIIIIAILLRIPMIQKKVVDKVTSFISSKTNTLVVIKKISISFPKAVSIEGLYLNDIKKDTLVYAGEVKVNIAFKDLFHHEIHVSSFAIVGSDFNIYRTTADSLFNYNFLLLAFSDTSGVKPDPGKTTKWTFRIDNVSVKNIHIKYNDDFTGMHAVAQLSNLNLKIEKLDLTQSVYKINELLLEDLKTNLITGNNISAPGQSVIADIKLLKIKNASADLTKRIIAAEEVSLSESKVEYKTNDSPGIAQQSAGPVTKSGVNNDWEISVKDMNLNDNSVSYQIENKPEIKGSFDVNHLQYNHLNLKAKGLFYSSERAEATINKFTAVDKNNFSIRKFETVFSMDQHSVTAKNLVLETANSGINADLKLGYPSFLSIKDSIQLMIINLDIRKISICNSDIIYFNPGISQLPFFKKNLTVTTVSGLINGSVKNISGKNLSISTGINTVLNTDFLITGLPDYKTSYFDIKKLNISSGRQDLKMIDTSLIPGTIDLPEKISLEIAFKGTMNLFESDVKLTSSFGSAHLSAGIDKKDFFSSKLNITGFNLGALLKNESMFGEVTLVAEASGHNLNIDSLSAKIKADVSDIRLNNYTYHKLNLSGSVSGKEFDGKITLDDENAAFDFTCLVNLNPGNKHYKFNLNLKGADLQKLNFTKNDVRIGFMMNSDIRGDSVKTMNGKAGISNIIIAHEGKTYTLDSVLFSLINKPAGSEFTISSSLVDMNYTGTVSPLELPDVLGIFVNRYFPFTVKDSVNLKSKIEPGDFNFEIQLHNDPVISEAFLPQLTEFWPGHISGSFAGEKNILKLKMNMGKIVYGTTEIADIAAEINGDVNALNYKVSCSSISNSLIKFDNFLVEGKLADNSIIMNLSSLDKKHNKKLQVISKITREKSNYKLTLDPDGFFVMFDKWNIAPDNYVEFGSEGMLIHNLAFNKAESEISIASINNKYNDDVKIKIKKFDLNDISGIVEKDSGLVKGKVDGEILLKRVNNMYGLIADATISSLIFRNIPIGDLYIKAENPERETFNLEAKLSGGENKLTAKGSFITKADLNQLNIKATIDALSMKSVEALSMGSITEASGIITGDLLVAGSTVAPDITGKLVFNNAFLKPAALNNLLQLAHETVELKKDGIYFNSFKVMDKNKHIISIDGAVNMEHFKNLNFSLRVNAQDFLLINTTAKDNPGFYGRMIIDSKIGINGPMTLPVINAKLKMKKGSNFTYAVSESNLTTDKGEDVVAFTNPANISPILLIKKEKQHSALTGFDITSIIEIDKEATLRLLLDPATSDSLVVKGDAALNFTIDRSGKMSLTGAYNLNEGSYLVSLESVIKRKFDINSGSRIIWNGDPLEADVSIDAVYSIRAAPIDLVADQTSGPSESDKNGYKQRYPFIVLLKLRGPIMHPDISFEIQLPPEEKSILGGAVNAKLTVLNQDPSALNKQVFALLVLGRFVRENPFQTETEGASGVIRTTVGKFLSAQLNQWSSKVIPGVELNFDIQSYNDYQTGQAQGRTQVDIGLKKQLFNERLSVQVGGVVDVEGQKAQQNSAGDITSDVSIEYKLTKDGRLRLKGFRHNQYEGAIEGQLVETGSGVLYVIDFNNWKDFFRSTKNKSDSLRITDKNDTIGQK